MYSFMPRRLSLVTLTAERERKLRRKLETYLELSLQALQLLRGIRLARLAFHSLLPCAPHLGFWDCRKEERGRERRTVAKRKRFSCAAEAMYNHFTCACDLVTHHSISIARMHSFLWHCHLCEICDYYYYRDQQKKIVFFNNIRYFFCSSRMSMSFCGSRIDAKIWESI